MVGMLVCGLGGAFACAIVGSWLSAGILAYIHGGWQEVLLIEERELLAQMPRHLIPGTRAYMFALGFSMGIEAFSLTGGVFLGMRLWRRVFVVGLGWMRDADMALLEGDPSNHLVLTGWRWSAGADAKRSARPAQDKALPHAPSPGTHAERPATAPRSRATPVSSA
jgi:hypothetical protein